MIIVVSNEVALDGVSFKSVNQNCLYLTIQNRLFLYQGYFAVMIIFKVESVVNYTKLYFWWP